jgi:hypothetical protein
MVFWGGQGEVKTRRKELLLRLTLRPLRRLRPLDGYRRILCLCLQQRELRV